MTALLERALVYAATGIPVFPCAPRAKVPATAHGFKDATTDLERVERWWWAQPRANIATPTGVTFDVVDFDRLQLYEQVRARHELAGPQVRTGRGAHWYVMASGLHTTKLAPDVDYKAAGGYVLLPPSRHPNGAVYEWLERGDPQPAPAWLRARLERHARALRPVASRPAGPVTARAVASLHAMAERLAHEPPGNRNRFLFWCARTAADTGATADDVAIVLRDAAQRAGLDDREIELTLTSAFARWP